MGNIEKGSDNIWRQTPNAREPLNRSAHDRRVSFDVAGEAGAVADPALDPEAHLLHSEEEGYFKTDTARRREIDELEG